MNWDTEDQPLPLIDFADRIDVYPFDPVIMAIKYGIEVTEPPC